jgi:hypothetical protein
MDDTNIGRDVMLSCNFDTAVTPKPPAPSTEQVTPSTEQTSTAWILPTLLGIVALLCLLAVYYRKTISGWL